MNFGTFDNAQKDKTKNIDALERLSDRDHQQLQMLRD
jgi:hypothetical protein